LLYYLYLLLLHPLLLLHVLLYLLLPLHLLLLKPTVFYLMLRGLLWGLHRWLHAFAVHWVISWVEMNLPWVHGAEHAPAWMTRITHHRARRVLVLVHRVVPGRACGKVWARHHRQPCIVGCLVDRGLVLASAQRVRACLGFVNLFVDEVAAWTVPGPPRHPQAAISPQPMTADLQRTRRRPQRSTPTRI